MQDVDNEAITFGGQCEEGLKMIVVIGDPQSVTEVSGSCSYVFSAYKANYFTPN